MFFNIVIFYLPILGNLNNFSNWHITFKVALERLKLCHLNTSSFSAMEYGDWLLLIIILQRFQKFFKLTFNRCYYSLLLKVKHYFIYNAFILLFRVIFTSYITKCYFSFVFVLFILYPIRMIRFNGENELNPGPRPIPCKNIPIYHWNLNSTAFHHFVKVKLLTAYNALHSFDIICISESISIRKHYQVMAIYT